MLVNAGGHGFYRVRYAPELLGRLLRSLDRLEAIERFNLVNDAWAAVLAGLMPLTEYLDLTVHFQGERDRNVWSVIVGSFQTLNRIVEEGDRPKLAALVRDRLAQAASDLDWSPRPGESELTGQLRGDLIRALGTVGDDAGVQARAAERFAGHPVDANVFAAIVPVLAHVGDAARYEDFARRFRTARTPQEEQRYLLALAGFRPPELVELTLAKTLNGDVRTQDVMYVLNALLLSVHGRERAWAFLQDNWERLNSVLPPNGMRRVCEAVVGLATAGLGTAGARVLRGQEGQPRRQETGAIPGAAADRRPAARSARRRRCGAPDRGIRPMNDNDKDLLHSWVMTTWSGVFNGRGEGDAAKQARHSLLIRYHEAVYHYFLAQNPRPTRRPRAVQQLRREAHRIGSAAETRRPGPRPLPQLPQDRPASHGHRLLPRRKADGERSARSSCDPAEHDVRGRRGGRSAILGDLAAGAAQPGLEGTADRGETDRPAALHRPALPVGQPRPQGAAAGRTPVGALLGKPYTPESIRQALHRAREKFAGLLLEEVERTLDAPTPDELEAELIALKLLSYCQKALDKRRKT